MRGGTPHDELEVRTASPRTLLQCSVGRARLSGLVNPDATFVRLGISRVSRAI